MFPLKVFQKHIMSYENVVKKVYVTLGFGYSTHVLVQNSKKLEHHSKLYLSVPYPKESRRGMFYNPQENKVFVSTNTASLKKDHIWDHQPRSKLILKEISKNAIDKNLVHLLK